jgi:hypothetical protein
VLVRRAAGGLAFAAAFFFVARAAHGTRFFAPLSLAT